MVGKCKRNCVANNTRWQPDHNIVAQTIFRRVVFGTNDEFANALANHTDANGAAFEAMGREIKKKVR